MLPNQFPSTPSLNFLHQVMFLWGKKGIPLLLLYFISINKYVLVKSSESYKWRKRKIDS